MAKNTVFRALLLLGLVVLLGSAIACGSGDNGTTGPPPPGKELNSPQLGNLGVYKHTFTTGGSYHYHCTIHSSMHGTVVVDSNSVVMSDSVSIINTTFNPASITVAPNATVKWTNKDNNVPHTVTSD